MAVIFSPHFSKGEREGDRLQTSGGSVGGVGIVKLPVGLQLMSRWFDEDSLFTLGEK